uniref:CRP-I 23 n=1 Tax=Mytilus galloprovincialis TaxID=29158 RepID=A0A0A7AC85_MYTGA|nr:CRP-I 23 [Mytilus galloprovincialis]
MKVSVCLIACLLFVAVEANKVTGSVQRENRLIRILTKRGVPLFPTHIPPMPSLPTPILPTLPVPTTAATM